MQPPFKNVQHEIGRIRNMTTHETAQFWDDMDRLLSETQKHSINLRMLQCDHRRTLYGEDSQALKRKIIDGLSGHEQRYAIGWYTCQ